MERCSNVWVSIPEGAIEGFPRAFSALNGSFGFNTRRCDWRLINSWPTTLFKNSFNTRRCDWRQLQTNNTTYSTVCFNTRRCDWRPIQACLNTCWEVCFNTRRCDWRTWRNQTPAQRGIVSIPEGAIEGRTESVKSASLTKFQYPKVRLKALTYASGYASG